ncbi:MAG: hypothetical protein ACRDYX_21240 [Egibacteraceae bacterium]
MRARSSTPTRDRLPHAQPPGVQMRPGQLHGAGQSVPADQADLGVPGVARVTGHLHLTDLEIGGQRLGAGLYQ